jgi:uncharacterized membrane protein YkvA (DUF1232 family)
MNRLRVIPHFLRDKTVPLRKKILVVACAAYILLPIDLVPVFPLDDLVLFLFVIIHLRDELDVYWKGEKKEDLSKKFRDKDIVDGVEFSVEDDSSESDHDGEQKED